MRPDWSLTFTIEEFGAKAILLNQMNGRTAITGNASAKRMLSYAAGASVDWLVAITVGILVCGSLLAPQSGAAWQASMWRGGSLVLALALVVVLKFNVARAGPFIVIFASWLFVVAIGAIARIGQTDSLNELIRHIYMIGIGALTYQACGSKIGSSIVRKFIWFTLVAIAIICIALVPDVMSGGWSWDKARVYKAVSLSERGIGFNSLILIMVVALVTLAKSSKAVTWVWITAFGVMLASSFLFATRAPFVSMAVAWAAVAAYSLHIRLGNQSVTRFGATALAVIGLALPLVALALIVSDPASPLARFGAGRIALWQISIAVWQENPIFGAGPNALMFGAQEFLNIGSFTAHYERNSILNLSGGGFHNLWLDTLASKGLIGLIGLLISYFLLLRTGLLRAADPQAMPFVILLFILLTRSFVEVSGQYGYQNSPLDLVVMIAIAATMRDAIAPIVWQENEARPEKFKRLWRVRRLNQPYA